MSGQRRKQRRRQIQLQCSNNKCNRLYPITEEELSELERSGINPVKCPYCEATNTCTMENMRAAIETMD